MCSVCLQVTFSFLPDRVPTWNRFYEMEEMPLKKLLFILPSVLLLAAAGLLLVCKRHADRTVLACLDSDL